MNISEHIIRAAASMSPQEREDLYLCMACVAAEHGDEREADIWLYHAERQSTWRELKE
jgi:hypothetical protein